MSRLIKVPAMGHSLDRSYKIFSLHEHFILQKIHVFLFDLALVLTRTATRGDHFAYQVHRQPVALKSLIVETEEGGKLSGSFRGSLLSSDKGKSKTFSPPWFDNWFNIICPRQYVVGRRLSLNGVFKTDWMMTEVKGSCKSLLIQLFVIMITIEEKGGWLKKLFFYLYFKVKSFFQDRFS